MEDEPPIGEKEVIVSFDPADRNTPFKQALAARIDKAKLMKLLEDLKEARRGTNCDNEDD